MIEKKDFDEEFNEQALRALMGDSEENKAQPAQPPVQKTEKPEEQISSDQTNYENDLSSLFNEDNSQPNKTVLNQDAENTNDDDDLIESLSNSLFTEPAQTEPTKQIKDDSLEFEDDLSDILGGEYKPTTEQVAQSVQAEVKPPTPKAVYEPGQELASSEGFVEEPSFDESERMPEDLFEEPAIVGDPIKYSEYEYTEDKTTTPVSQQTENSEPQEQNQNLSGSIEDLFVKPEEPKQTVEEVVKPAEEKPSEQTDNKTQDSKHTGYISYDDVGGKKRLALYCAGAILFGAAVFYSAPHIDSFVNKHIEPYLTAIVRYGGSKNNKTNPNTEASANQENKITETPVDEQNGAAEQNTTRPSLKELMYNRYHR